MKLKLKSILLPLIIAFTLMLIPSSVVYAASCGNADSAKGQVLQGVGLTGDNCDDAKVNSIFAIIVNLLSIVVGILAIIAILYAGAKYILSSGDSGKVENAKSTLIYAIVGLAVASLAQLLVHFVLFRATNA